MLFSFFPSLNRIRVFFGFFSVHQSHSRNTQKISEIEGEGGDASSSEKKTYCGLLNVFFRWRDTPRRSISICPIPTAIPTKK